jgi:proteic killer suppression protein
MIVIFNEVYLEELYEFGKCSDKKHRYQHDIVRRYQKAINFLKSSATIETLWKINSLSLNR